MPVGWQAAKGKSGPAGSADAARWMPEPKAWEAGLEALQRRRERAPGCQI